jgi:hypothetical protein
MSLRYQTQPVESKEELTVEVVANVTLDTQPVAFAILPENDPPDDGTVYTDGDWMGDPGTTREAQIIVGPGGAIEDLTAGWYDIYVRVTDPAVTPVIFSGRLRLY